MSKSTRVALSVACEPQLARIVRMTAANVATLSSMSVDRVEDIRMAAEEAFIYACAAAPSEELSIDFEVDPAHVSMVFGLSAAEFPEPSEDDPSGAYADLILGSVCDLYEKQDGPARLVLDLKADVHGV